MVVDEEVGDDPSKQRHNGTDNKCERKTHDLSQRTVHNNTNCSKIGIQSNIKMRVFFYIGLTNSTELGKGSRESIESTADLHRECFLRKNKRGHLMGMALIRNKNANMNNTYVGTEVKSECEETEGGEQETLVVAGILELKCQCRVSDSSEDEPGDLDVSEGVPGQDEDGRQDPWETHGVGHKSLSFEMVNDERD